MSEPPLHVADAEILAARPPRNAVDPWRPYAWLVEPERSAAGIVEPVATIFLTNRECPFRCLYCDLWKNTTETTVPHGAIPAQIDYALSRLPPARHIKLYNSGNFFDARAIPPSDLPAIAARVRDFETVIVENHPRLCGEACLRFRDRLQPRLEIALGLETIHPAVLPALNKRMTVEDYDRAVELLKANDISVRTFILLRPPFMTEEEGVTWAVRSLEHAFEVGAGCCAVIPVRAGNGIMERLQREGRFAPPELRSLERVLEAGIAMLKRRGEGARRVFVDLWDAEKFSRCARCGPARIERLQRMNETQELSPPILCDCGTTA
jgi:radical SAM enzyme (TIGR01210 family)